MDKISLKIPELDCAEECKILRKAVKDEVGVDKFVFDIVGQEMQIWFDPNQTTARKLLNAVRSTGMKATLASEKEVEPPSFWQEKGRLILCIVSGVLLATGFLLHLLISTPFSDISGFAPHFAFPPLPLLLLYLGSIVAGGWFVAPKAIASLKRLSPDMNLLMLVAVVGAMAIGQWFEAATVTFLFSLALLLESWSADKARRAISALLDLSPKIANVFENGQIAEKPIEEVEVGTRILVRPGEKIPLDGTVVKGISAVNQAPITGESLPVSKAEGDPLFAGTINEDGALEFVVTKKASDTTLSRIIQMVQSARTRRAASEKWVDQFARIYTPIMMVLAVVVAVLPPLIFSDPWLDWIYRGLVLLVIACPCALVISTPVTIVSSLTSAARNGVLIKGGIYLEVAGILEAIAFDKTGTITKGKPRVQRIIPLNDHTEKQLLEIAAKLEKPSEHPLARAILDLAKEKEIDPSPAEDFQIFKGLGAEGTIEGKRFWIGSHRFMHERNHEEDEAAHNLALELEDEGHSVIAVGDFTHVCGLISVADEPREEIASILSKIKRLGVKTIAMLTGDNQKTAETLAKVVGIDTFYAELLPEDKVEKIEELKRSHQTIAMVGDGVNDAPAMAASSLGIAMGAMGSDVAFETADIVLMEDDVTKIPWLIERGRKTLRVVKQNISFSLMIKALFITLAILGYATLWMAIAADTGASLLVTFSGMRMLKR